MIISVTIYERERRLRFDYQLQYYIYIYIYIYIERERERVIYLHGRVQSGQPYSMIFQVLSSPSAFDLDFLVKTNRNLRLILGPQSADKKGFIFLGARIPHGIHIVHW
jgi:hypothetical protein